MCGCVFQGRRSDFLPRQVIRRAEAMSTTSASLKRKREIDEDVDLYGEEETTEKKSKNDDFAINENNVEFAQQSEEVAKSEEMEWLMFLVSQEGELQVTYPLY